MKKPFLYPRQFISDLLFLYKQLTCLWKIDSPEYEDPHERERCFALLLQKFREVRRDADKKCLQTKIGALRHSFKVAYFKSKEYQLKYPNRKHRSSYPYFEQMKFLAPYYDEEWEFRMKEKKDRKKERECKVSTRQGTSTGSKVTPESHSMEIASSSIEDVEKPTFTDQTQSSFGASGISTGEFYSQNNNETLNNSSSMRICYNSMDSSDEFEKFGSYVAANLRKFTQRQCMFSQKLITDILLEASLENLNENTLLIKND